jgi:3-hydroxyisobutyrate dehydrogenase
MRVAVLGIGAMGSRMAYNLLKAGHDVFVWNRNASATRPLLAMGAHVCDSPRLAAVSTDVVIACVRDDAASREVWLNPETGAMSGLRHDAIAIESSTLSVAWTRELAGRAKWIGRDFLDAPVLGSRPQAEAAALIHVVGGDLEVLERARPALTAVGVAAHWMGPAGSGAAMKLFVNAMLGIQVAALGELLPAMRRLGLPPEKIAEVFAQTAVCSRAAKAAADSMVSRDFSTLFAVELIQKDLGYLVSEAGISMTPLSKAAQDVFMRALREGMGKLNQTAIVELYETVGEDGET